jgi:hypothetical protein
VATFASSNPLAPSPGGIVTDPGGRPATFSVFSTIGWTGVGAGIILMLISPILKRSMHLQTLGKDRPDDDPRGQDGDVMAGEAQLSERYAAVIHKGNEMTPVPGAMGKANAPNGATAWRRRAHVKRCCPPSVDCWFCRLAQPNSGTD